jgi:hypothetical protein
LADAARDLLLPACVSLTDDWSCGRIQATLAARRSLKPLGGSPVSKLITTILASLLFAGAASAQGTKPMVAPGSAGIPGAPAAQVSAATLAATAQPQAVSAGSASASATPAPASAAPVPAPAPAAAMPAPAAGPASTTPAPATAAAGGVSDKVWLNTRSKVYHCPGTQYYGKTKVGEYMSEVDAKAKGGHAGEGTGCKAG